MKLVGTASIVALLLASYGTASAIALATPLVSTTAPHIPECVVTNTSPSPVTLDVVVRDYYGVLVIPTFDDCAPDLAPQASCSVTGPAGTDMSCSITASSSRIRALIGVYDSSGTLIAAVPATRK